MNELDRALCDFAALFNKLGVPYAIMGGLAVRVYGIPRPTHDVDITLAIDRERLPQLYEAVRRLGYTVPESYLAGWLDRVAGMPVVKFRRYLRAGYGVDIDLFLAESQFQDSILSRRQPLRLDETPAWLVSAEDLILLKLLAGRPRDLADVGDILFTQGQLDEGYMCRWAEQLGILDTLHQVLGNPPL